LLAKHFGGALPFVQLEKMTSRQIDRYYRIYEWQATEENIVNEHLYPPHPAKPKALPKPERMAQLVEQRIKEKYQKTLDEEA
jgi:hypothetical protein